MAVATPTGALQGVAAASWDGSAWQPAGRTGPAVATPTGVLQGVAPFTWDGSAWQPSGRAAPGVATPTGVLDGVAVYTWSGSAWTPTGGQPTPSTPSGALRGIAAFSWDGSAWQPAGQAGPSVATPYGLLQGVAMFNWTGSTWIAAPAASLDLSFMTPGTLDPRITFSRASTGTYFDVAGTLQAAATNAPRWDYNPSTHALNGLLIEETRTNILLQSANFTNAAWVASSNVVAAPTVTANQATAPDGTLTAARVIFPAVAGASAVSDIYQLATTTANPFAFSVWLKGNSGGEQIYVSVTDGGATYYTTLATLTTSWQRFTVVTATLTAAAKFFFIGIDLRDAAETNKPAQTVFMWGAQAEAGAFTTSYIPTTVASVARSGEFCDLTPLGAWFSNSTTWTSQLEFLTYNPCTAGGGFLRWDDTAGTNAVQFYGNNIVPLGIGFTAVASGTTNVNTGLTNFAAGVVHRAAMTITAAGDTCAMDGAILSLGITPVPVPTGLNRIHSFGQIGAGVVRALNGYVRRVRYWPRELTNAELQAVTT